MWISRDEYLRLKACEATATKDAVLLATHAATIEWMRVRLNQVETERAQLLAHVTKLDVLVPTIGRVDEPRPIETAEAGGILDAVSSLFEDIGDEAAAKIGARHDQFGALQFVK